MSAHGTEPNVKPLLFPDPVIEAYIKDVDRTLIREQLKRTPSERLQSLMSMVRFYEECRAAETQRRAAIRGKQGV